MQIIEVVYSPLCEATGAMIGKLRQWLEGTDVQIRLIQNKAGRLLPLVLSACSPLSEICPSALLSARNLACNGLDSRFYA